jgi:hypothetical protein
VPKRASQPANPAGEELALQIMAVVGGAGAVVALPLLIAVMQERAPIQVLALTFAFPLALATVGRLRDQRTLQVVAAVVAALIVLLLGLSAMVAGSGTLATMLGSTVMWLLALGAPASMIVVGRYLLGQDRFGGLAWLSCTALGLILGFVAVTNALSGMVPVVLLVVLVGSGIAVKRLRRKGPRSPQQP